MEWRFRNGSTLRFGPSAPGDEVQVPNEIMILDDGPQVVTEEQWRYLQLRRGLTSDCIYVASGALKTPDADGS